MEAISGFRRSLDSRRVGGAARGLAAAHARRRVRPRAAMALGFGDRLQRNAGSRELRRVSRRTRWQANADRPAQQPLAQRAARRRLAALCAARFRESYQERSDLWVQRGGREHQLTFGQRLTSPDVRADGRDRRRADHSWRHASRSSSRPDGKRVTPLTAGQLRRAVDRAALVARRRSHRRVALASRQHRADRRGRHDRPHRSHGVERNVDRGDAELARQRRGDSLQLGPDGHRAGLRRAIHRLRGHLPALSRIA